MGRAVTKISSDLIDFMTVLKRFRTPAKMEVLTNARRIRKAVFFFLARDLGLRQKVRRLEFCTAAMPEQERAQFLATAERYDLTATSEYPQWVIDKFRDTFWALTLSIEQNVTAANAVYVTNTAEASERRILQDRALYACEQALKEMEFAGDCFPIAGRRFLPVAGLVVNEIALIKGWRKSDNKRTKNLQDNIL